MLELNNGLEQGQGDLSVHLRPEMSETRRDIKVKELLSYVLRTLPRQTSIWGRPWHRIFPLQLSGNLGCFSLCRGMFQCPEHPCLVFGRNRILPTHRKRVIVFNTGVLQRLTYKNTTELDQAIKSCHPKCVFLSSLDKGISFLSD